MFGNLYFIGVRAVCTHLIDTGVHKKYSGVGNELILENFKRLLKSSVPVWGRIPLVAGVNDGVGERSRRFLRKTDIPKRRSFSLITQWESTNTRHSEESV